MKQYLLLDDIPIIAESGAVSIGVRLTTKDSFSVYLKVVSSIPSTGSVTLGYVCW